jgi:hypothetical protein
VNPPACYNKAIYKCVNTNQLVPGSETVCSIPKPESCVNISPSPPSPPPGPPPIPPPPRPPSPPPPPPRDPGEVLLVAPVSGTLTSNPSAPIPFGRADNIYTARPLRMPALTSSSPPFPTSAWWTNFIWGAGSSFGEDPVQQFPYHVRAQGPPRTATAAANRGMHFCKPFYTGDNSGGVIMGTWAELQVRP